MTDRLTRIQEMLKSNPDDAFLLFALAQEYRNTERLPEAREAFKALREKHVEYVGLYYHYADVLAVLSQQEEAKEVYISGIEIAQKLGDQHALAELKNAYLNWQIEQD